MPTIFIWDFIISVPIPAVLSSCCLLPLSLSLLKWYWTQINFSPKWKDTLSFHLQISYQLTLRLSQTHEPGTQGPHGLAPYSPSSMFPSLHSDRDGALLYILFCLCCTYHPSLAATYITDLKNFIIRSYEMVLPISMFQPFCFLNILSCMHCFFFSRYTLFLSPTSHFIWVILFLHLKYFNSQYNPHRVVRKNK